MYWDYEDGYQWKDPDPNAGTMCEVTYDANGGTLSDTAANGKAMERGKVEEIRFVEELATAPSGMVFDGIEVEGVKYGPTDSWTVPDQDAVTVKFLWREVGGVCTLTLDINGGTKGEEWTDTIELTQGDEESVPDNVENMAIAPPCKVFSGLDLEGKTYEPGEKFTVPAKETAVVKFIWADGEHTWGEWETVKEPTATDTGLKKRICSVCGEEETEAIPATGNGGTDDNGGNSGTPATGDENSVLLYMLISGIALSGVIITRRNLN